MRGERAFRSDCGALAGGSSPHARGTLRQPCNVAPGGRFIPACAGNARPSCGSRPRRTVHPRMRGEREMHKVSRDRSDGSSPHARGTPAGRIAGRAQRRFIPACAGNALFADQITSLMSVHPRMRGERVGSSTVVPRVSGSSPHARGTPGNDATVTCTGRFIPACAGNAFRWFLYRCTNSVHPRMRGERWTKVSKYRALFGSSPHARGTLAGGVNGLDCRRFIPACAGNAGRLRSSTARRTVHPRMRGEREMHKVARDRADGSSPHARGTLSPCRCKL